MKSQIIKKSTFLSCICCLIISLSNANDEVSSLLIKSSTKKAKTYNKAQRYEKLLTTNNAKKTITKAHIFISQNFVFFAPLTQEKQITSWSEMRDNNLTKQQYDYSCGAASLSSILEHYYGLEKASEKEILDSVLLSKGIDITQKEAIQFDEEAKQKAHLSFYDMVKYAENRGFKAFGLGVSLPALYQLKAPVIIYVKVRNIEHFSVLKGIDSRFVYLADPSFGNIKVSIAKFIEMFYPKKTRQEKAQEKKLQKAQMQAQKNTSKNTHKIMQDSNKIDSAQMTESINRSMRGKIMAIVPQEPQAQLTPTQSTYKINTEFMKLEKHSGFVYENIKDNTLFRR